MRRGGAKPSPHLPETSIYEAGSGTHQHHPLFHLEAEAETRYRGQERTGKEKKRKRKNVFSSEAFHAAVLLSSRRRTLAAHATG